MPVFAVLNSGQLTNVIEATPEVAASLFPGSVRIDHLPEVPGIGWRWTNKGGFYRPGDMLPPSHGTGPGNHGAPVAAPQETFISDDMQAPESSDTP